MKALDMILFWANENYHPVYEQYLIEKYEEEHGPHFNEEKARETVACLRHMEHEEWVKGEHWSIEQVENCISQYNLGEYDTKWDFYVAINTWYHDMCVTYRNRNDEENLIPDAVTFFFEDEDADEGKIWKYSHLW